MNDNLKQKTRSIIEVEKMEEEKKKRMLKLALILFPPYILFTICSYLAFDFIFNTCTGVLIYTAAHSIFILLLFFVLRRMEETTAKLIAYITLTLFLVLFIFLFYGIILEECIGG